MWGCDFSLTTLACRGRGSTFTPAAVSGLLAWHDPSDLSTLFQDVAMTMPVTASGQAVAAMKDKSGHGYHLTQATASKRPIYTTSGGLYWLESDGVDDAMGVASRFGLAANPDLTVVAGMRWLGTKADERAFEIGSGSGALSGGCGTDGWAWRYNNGNALFGSPSNGTDRVATWMHQIGGDYGSSQFWRNGVQLSLASSSNGTVVPSSTSASATVMNGGTSSVTGAKMRLYGMVVGNFFDRTRAAQIESWMAARSGVTL